MDAPVLLLNANYEPLNICSLHRAINLLISEKAALVLDERGVIRTVKAMYPRPSVIRLHHMVHRPPVRVHLTRAEIFRRDNHTCQYCGRRYESTLLISSHLHVKEMHSGQPVLTIDHVLPRHLGGKHTWTNVVTACRSCNHKKGGRTLEEAHLALLTNPREPSRSAGYIFGRRLKEFPEWEQFLAGW